jgi:glycosyltransferase involved in cell wall biosynthesis
MRLIYFSPVPASTYAQRPHFTVQAWLELGAESVLWVNPYPCRLPRLGDFKRIGRSGVQGTAIDGRITVLDVPALPIEPLPGGPWLNRRLLWRGVWKKITDFIDERQTTVLGIGRPGALALAALRELQYKSSFYDAMDNFPEFHRGLSRQAARYYVNAIASEADLVLASSSYLAAKFINRGLDVRKVPNAYPMATLPPWQPVVHDNVVLGYLGCVGSWFDWPLVVEIARRLPHARLELIGPMYVSPPRNLPSNIHLFPPCKQSETSVHLARFSAGLIPFRNNALTSGVDPIKYYEYRAAGLPVLSTSFGEMALRNAGDGVYFLDQTNDIASVVEKALQSGCDPATVLRFRRDNDWRERFITASPFGKLLSDFTRQKAA